MTLRQRCVCKDICLKLYTIIKSQMLFVPRRPSRGLLFRGLLFCLSVTLSRFATRCGRTVAISTPRICRKNSNVKTNRAVRFSADKYAEAEAI